MQGESTVLAVLVIGAGFSGIGMGIRLRQAGIEDFLILERAGEIGGTWRDNHYPGAACDVESHLYSFSFEPRADWSRKYSGQAEILDYLQHCVRRYGLAPHIRCNATMTAARYDEAGGHWSVQLASGEVLRTRVLVSAVGALSEPAIPALPGLADFRGVRFHSAQWDHTQELSGKRVAVIGTGASAIQFVPPLAEQAGQLLLFQRTPPWILPKADRTFSPGEKRLLRLRPLQWLYRALIYWINESRVPGFSRRSDWLLKPAERMALHHLRRQVRDPELRRALTPDYRIGCKRILIANDYYPALQRPNVRLVRSAIAQIGADHIDTQDGQRHAVDTLIFATGFRATEYLHDVDIVGRQGLSLREAWRDGGEAYLGIACAGFPNFFMLTGPNTGLGHSSMIFMIEAQLSFILQGIQRLHDEALRSIEVHPEAQQAFNAQLQQRMANSVWTSGCRSWYLDAHGRNTTLWPASTLAYWRQTRRWQAEAFTLEPNG
jgi:cation diffusion facilitator CzcD-associated flavoprotein CzcO